MSSRESTLVYTYFLKNVHIDVAFAIIAVWKNEKFSLNERKFRQINYLVISLVKTVNFTKFLPKSVRVNFRAHWTAHCIAH